MKILFVLENYHPNIGGVETLFFDLVEQLKSSGHQVKIVTTRHPDRVRSAHIIEVPTRNRYLFTLLGLMFCVKQTRWADLVHTTSYNAAFPARISSFVFNRPCLITFHEYWGELWREMPFISRFQAWANSVFEKLLIYLRFDWYIGVSEYTARRLSEVLPQTQKIMAIHNGLDYESFDHEYRGHDSNEFVFFGRCGISKGIDLITEASEILAQRDSKAKILVITNRASGPKIFDHLMASAKKHPKTLRVETSMSFEDLKAQIVSSRAALVPSYSEGFGFSAVEACAMGVPVIHSGRGALEEVLSGKLIKMKSLSGRGLADAIDQAMEGNWTTISNSRSFTLSECTQKYTSLYSKIIEKK